MTSSFIYKIAEEMKAPHVVFDLTVIGQSHGI